MAKVIEVDDLEVGMFVTVLEWHDDDQSYVGEVLKVMAIDAPFVAANRAGETECVDLDTRKLRLAQVSDEYAKAMLSAVQGSWFA